MNSELNQEFQTVNIYWNKIVRNAGTKVLTFNYPIRFIKFWWKRKMIVPKQAMNRSRNFVLISIGDKCPEIFYN